MSDTRPKPAVTRTSSTLAHGTLARFAGEAAGALFGLIVGAMTARYLGPTGKGTLSTLSYLVALMAPLCAFGLGEASQTLFGRGRMGLERCVRAVSGLLAVTTGTGVIVLMGLIWLMFSGEIPGLRLAIVAASLTLPLITYVTIFGILLDSAGQVVFVSFVRLCIAASTAVSTVVLMYFLELAITGALLAIVAGWSVGLVLLLVRLHRLKLGFWPRWDPGFLREAIPLGIPTQLSYLVIVASTRVDLLLVRALAGSSEAGSYSVALTVGQVTTYAPVALAVAAFPVIASIRDDEKARELVGRVCRTTVLTALLGAAVLGAAVPVGIPLTFGREFTPAIGPTLLLLVGGVLWGAQWTACRAESARGRPRILLRSFGVSLVVMLIADLALIPRLGLMGAAAASVLSSAVGLAVVIRSDGGGSRTTPGAREFLPRWPDLAHLTSTLSTYLGRGGPPTNSAL